MTSSTTLPATRPPVAPARRRRPATVAIVLGWIVVAVLAVLALTTTGSDSRDAIVVLLAFAVTAPLPGIALWRALARPTTAVQELGFGTGAGLAVALLTWALQTLAGAPALGWLLPPLLIGVLLLVPATRRRMTAPRPQRLRGSVAGHLLLAGTAAASLAIVWLTHLRSQPLPPAASATYNDLWYHTTLVGALQRSIVPADLSAAGETAEYHWFAHADMALLSSMSAVPPYEVVLHAWYVPAVLAFVLTSAAAVEVLQGRRVRGWVAPLGVLLAIIPTTVWAGATSVSIGAGFTVLSPTSIFASVVICAAPGAVREALAAGNGWRGWVLLGAVFAAGAGAKPSVLPVFVTGGLLLLALRLIARRRRRSAAALTVAPVLLLLLSAGTALVGAAGSSRPQIGQTLALSPVLSALVGDGYRRWSPGDGGVFAPLLQDGGRATWALALLVLLGSIAANSMRLLGVLGLLDRRVRGDPVWVWAAGTVIGGFTAQWLLSHQGYSQIYFWLGVTPLGAALTIATAARLWPPGSASHPRLLHLLVPAAGLCVGLVQALTLPRPGNITVDRAAALALQLAIPYIAGAAVLVLVLLLLRATRRPVRRAQWLSAGIVYVLALCLPFAAMELGPRVTGAAALPAPTGEAWRAVSSAEQEAALWVAENSPTDDVVATNVFCQPVELIEPCNTQSFWLAAIASRQLVLGGWAYTTDNTELSLEGLDTRAYADGPFPERVDLIEAAVGEGSPDALHQLREEYSADLLFVSLRATVVSPRLDEEVEAVFENAEVRVYDLGAGR